MAAQRNGLFEWLFPPSPPQAPAGLAAVRAMGGLVFIASGFVKLLYENQGALRFAKLGLPAPLATFVSLVEVVAGLLLLLGLFSRPAAIALAIDMTVAVITTKAPLLFGAGPEPIGAPPKTGFWAFAHQARLDILLLCLCVTILLCGSGEWSLDARRAKARDGRLADRAA